MLFRSLILPAGSHSLNGIMRANLDLTNVVQRFMPEQRDALHAVLRTHPGIGELPNVEPPVAAPPPDAVASR